MNRLLLIILTILALVVGCSDSPETIEEYLAAAEKEYNEGNYFEARKLLTEAIKLDPTDKEIIYQVGRNYAAEHMYDSSFAHLSRANKLYPNDRRINTLLHQVSVETGHWKDAIQALLSLSHTGDPIESHYKQMAEYAIRGELGYMADYYYGKLIEVEPDSMSYYIHQAEGALIMRNPVKSIEIMKQAIKRFGDHPKLLSDLGKYYSLNEDLVDAEKTLRLLVSRDSSVLSQLQLATALALQENRSKKEEAYSLFKILRDESPNRTRVDSIITALQKELAE